ncbi:MAG: tetratricopeptide repeat protein [Candidatus Sericytochromatia bacterium]
MLARLHQQQHDWSQAQDVLEELLKVDFQLAQAWYELGRCQLALIRPQLALTSLQRAQQLSPHQASVWSVMGRAHHDLFDLEKAVFCYQRALKLCSDHAGLWSDLGNIWRHLEELEKAHQCYQQALKCNPRNGSAQLNRSLLQLIQNQPQGWRFFKQLRLGRPWHFPQPSRYWDGVIRRDQPLAIIEEYGRGDLIQMLRFVPRLLAAGQPCAVCVQQGGSWKRLIATLGLDLPVYEPQEWKQTPVAAYFCYDADLPAYFHCLPHGDKSPRYFFPPPSVPPPTPRPGAPRIGLVWASGALTSDRSNTWSYKQRSLPFQALLPLLTAYPQFNFYSFQIGEDAAQMHGFNTLITDLQPLIHDFYATACLLEHMDLVISVDTAVAHLAGALQRPTWLLLAQGPDWRWGLKNRKSDWYPSMRLFRQKKLLNWAPVLNEVVDALRANF